MDPLTALSVAGTIVQFADFGSKMFSEGCQMYKSANGAVTANEELELVIFDLRELTKKLPKLFHGQSVTSTPLNDMFDQLDVVDKICEEAARLAEEILRRLDRLKVEGQKHRMWKSFSQAIKCAWTKEEIAVMVKRLAAFKDALVARVTYSIW
jgi:hypothetical protein